MRGLLHIYSIHDVYPCWTAKQWASSFRLETTMSWNTSLSVYRSWPIQLCIYIKLKGDRYPGRLFCFLLQVLGRRFSSLLCPQAFIYKTSREQPLHKTFFKKSIWPGHRWEQLWWCLWIGCSIAVCIISTKQKLDYDNKHNDMEKKGWK